MQPIQDKDFDQLFKDAFDGAEVKPSRDLWNDIESGIDAKKKRIMPVYWMAAAALIVLATVSMLMYRQAEQQPKVAAAKPTEQILPRETISQKTIEPARTTIVDQVEPVFVAQKETKGVVAKSSSVKSVTETPTQKVEIAESNAQKQEPVFAKVDDSKKDLNQKIEEIIQQQPGTVIAANPAVLKTDVVVTTNPEPENKSIRNVGDVVNFIVNTVDKRKEKIIQFRTDDDDSSIASINIGPFKFGKRNKK
ncbi:hypothetical protein ACJVDH_02980 [Pedobacter sp. AW1-32]|uniref:hypothetical protein n=1 Tax=Pedobacter sp. AW1-32 TaxID=3383026 RepID=UPI003FF06FD8